MPVHRFWTAPAMVEVVAGCVHLVSLPVIVLALKGIMESTSGHVVSWEYFDDELTRRGLMPGFSVGVVAQVAFAGLALGIGARCAPGGSAIWLAAMAIGLSAVFVSLAWLGGLVGATGGVLSFVAGVVGLVSPPPAMRAEARGLTWRRLPPPLPPLRR